jgi:hypothetical protein
MQDWGRRYGTEGNGERRETKIWEPKVKEKVLVKTQPASDAAVGVTAKFIHTYEGPYIISKVISPPTYELSTTKGNITGEFNTWALKPYLEVKNSNAEGRI